MNSRTLSYIVVGVFLLFGSVFIAIRHHAIRAEQAARESSLWRLSYDIDFETTAESDEVKIALPFDTRFCRVVSESINEDPGLRTERHGPYVASGTRELWVSARQPEKYNFRASFELLLSPRADMSRVASLENLSRDHRTQFLREEEHLPTTVKAVVDKAREVAGEGTDAQRVQGIFNFSAGIDSAGPEQLDGAEEAVENSKGSPLAKARAMVTLCRAIRIPARLVTGFEIKQNSSAKPHVWVEVYQEPSWISFDPEHGYSFTMPMQFVPVRRGGGRGGGKVVKAPGITMDPEKYSIRRIEPPASVLQSGERHPIQIFNLRRLPVPTHKVIKILLLLPFAALITSVLRNVIGIHTFGTFAPALLAMSFIYAKWQTGLAILLVIAIAGFVSRTFLDRLRLLMVPRLSIMLTIVILCVVFGVSIMDYMLPSIGTDAVLLPMVILTLLIERFYVSTEEDGPLFTLKLAAGTLFVAALCYLMLGWDSIGEFVLVYPESHFFTIAVFILLGRYAGYRLTELWRFRDLVAPIEKPS